MAVLAAFTLSVANVFTKGALRHAPPFTGALIFALAPLVLLGPWLPVLVPLEAGAREGFLWFLLSGVVHPGLAITFVLLGNQRVGISRTSTIAAVAPLISVLIGVFFLGERPDWTVWLGGLLIMGGVVTLSGEKSGDRFKRKDLLFPILAGLAMGVTPVLRKMGLTHVPFPICGVVTAALGGVLGLSAMACFFPRGERLRLAPKGLLFFGWAASFALAGRL
ncbi:MAG: DMT family transporter, partial [Nitrospinota bacterium]|nr:DMT family transporter [Nitrospinota bacterium]